MKRAGRLLMRLGVFALVVLALVATLAWAARGYLSSRQAADKVAGHISALYGGPIQLDAVDIGMDGSSLRGLRLYEADTEDGEPWLTVEHVQADLGAWDLIGDDPTPANLHLESATVTLRFDAAGHLLTRIPPRPAAKARVPTLHLRDANIAIRQEGRPEFVVHSVEAHLEAQEGQLALTGTVTDPHWGEWTLSGHIDPTTGAADTQLNTDRANVTMDKLRSIPFVSSKVWEEVQAEGTTPVQFTLHFDPAAGSWKYRVELHPENADVNVRAIALHADQAHGTVVIEDGLVTLRDVQGRTADGAIQTTADLDFRKPLRQMHYMVTVKDVDIRRLPKTWHISALVSGRLTGHAVLNVTVGGEPRVLTIGQGVGLLNGTLPIRLRADATGFHFSL